MGPASIVGAVAFIAALVVGVSAERAEGARAKRLWRVTQLLILVGVGATLWMSFAR